VPPRIAIDQEMGARAAGGGRPLVASPTSRSSGRLRLTLRQTADILMRFRPSSDFERIVALGARNALEPLV
jgi:hypothetical protein